MNLKAIIPPCYNAGDKNTTVDVSIDKNIKALEMFARLTEMVNEGNVYCSYDKEQNEGLIIIIDNTVEVLTDNAKLIAKNADEITEVVTATKPLSKIGSATMATVGTAMDIASLSLNITGAVQAFQDDDVFNGSMYVLGGVGDAISIAET